MRLRTVSLLMLAAAAFAAAQAAGPSGSAASLESGSAARITRIAAAAAPDGSGIEVTFASSDPRRELLVFWGTAPITAPADLLRSTARAQLGAGTVRYAVPVAPGTDWWFAVLDARLYAAGGAPLVPGENATTRGVRVTAAAAPATAGAPHRGQPLPSLQLPVSVETGRDVEAGGLPEVPAERDVSPATALAIAELLRAAGPASRQILKVQVLDALPDGADAALRSVAAGALAGGDWAGAEKQLNGYLDLPRTPPLRARARFYLGQALWFQGRPREAFFEFLLCEDFVPRESRAWQDACLGELASRD